MQQESKGKEGNQPEARIKHKRERERCQEWPLYACGHVYEDAVMKSITLYATFKIISRGRREEGEKEEETST